jgi:hypothetical protein
MLTFEPEGHVYRWSGRVVPSVTQVLARCHDFGFISREMLEAAQDRGTYVHALCELDDMGDLDEDAERDGEFFGYLLGWRKFVADYRPNWAVIEQPFFSEGMDIAGTPDRAGVLETLGTDTWVIDIKSSVAKHRVWGMQLAAYRRMIAEKMGLRWHLARRASVRLTPDGLYKFDEYPDKRDLPAFLGLVQYLDWETSP